MNELREHLTLGEIVSRDYRAAAVLERYGLDYCCGGRRSVADACRSKGIDPAAVLTELQSLESDATRQASDYQNWSVDELINHILTWHHAYLRTALPRLTSLLAKLSEVHGARHPELLNVEKHFADLRIEMESHLRKEEEVLFPYIRAQGEAARDNAAAPPNIFGTVGNPIRMMESEHQHAGNELILIHELTRGHQVPPDGCATYRVAMEELKAFERDLFLHIHLENNILFRKALLLETEQAARNGTLPSERWNH
jgi:regulator of cell morphogenesis and NO signaling